MFERVSLFFTLLVLVSSGFSATVDPKMKLDSKKEPLDILVTMKESNAPVLDKLTARSFPTREERLNSVAKKARKFAWKSQSSLLDVLSKERQSRSRSGKVEPEVTSLWITNQVAIKNADAALIKKLSKRPDMEKVQLIPSFERDDPVDDDDDPTMEGDSNDGEDGPWGIENMNVPLVWAKGIRGEGVLVGHMDSGVRHTHEALQSNYIGEGGWIDVGQEKYPEPHDNDGHGTGSMSLIVGTTRNIGVAPGARWMACGMVNYPRAPFYLFDELKCAQWLVCPGGSMEPGVDPGGQNCSQAPHVINHSTAGIYDNADLFNKPILYYHAAGIIPIYSAANAGPECGILGYPAGFSYVISVGAIQKDNKVWKKSSRGPPRPDKNLIKPDLVAPGHRVRVANITNDSSYRSVSGTSFSGPYVTGVVALMLSKNPRLSFKQVKEILLAASVPTVGNGESCGEKPDDVFPNYIAGHGRLDANKAIEYMETMKY